MNAIAVLLFAAAVAYGISHLLRVPALPVLLLAGVALTFVARVPGELLEDTLVLGVTILLFVTGMELSPTRTRAQRLSSMRVGLLHFVLLGTIGFLAAMLLGYRALYASYIALALTASSTLVVVRLLQRRAQLFEPSGRLVLGVLLLQDVLILLMVPVFTRLPLGVDNALYGFAGTVGLLFLAGAIYRFGPALFQRFDAEDEVMLLVLFGILFAFIALADLMELPLLTGAFLGGFALARFPLSGMARPRLASIAEFFSALFYIALGALIGVPSATELLHALAFTLLVVVLTPPLVTIIAERAGMSTRAAIESGLLLSQTSEISLVLGLFGLLARQITPQVFTIIALVTLSTMLLTPFIASERVAWWLMRLRPVPVAPRRRKVDQEIPQRDHVLVLGLGSTGLPLLETLLASSAPILVIDDDPIVVDRLREAEIPCLRGDASDELLLRQANADKARIITSTIRRPQDNRRLLEFAKGVPTLVRVFDEQDAEWIRELGGTPVLASHAAADEMMKWFDKRHPG